MRAPLIACDVVKGREARRDLRLRCETISALRCAGLWAFRGFYRQRQTIRDLELRGPMVAPSSDVTVSVFGLDCAARLIRHPIRTADSRGGPGLRGPRAR